VFATARRIEARSPRVAMRVQLQVRGLEVMKFGQLFRSSGCRNDRGSIFATGNRSLIVDASRLKDNERLEFKYDGRGNIIAVEKKILSAIAGPREAQAVTVIQPGGCGQVFFQGTYWRAKCDVSTRIEVGQTVWVKARQDLMLWVVPTEP